MSTCGQRGSHGQPGPSSSCPPVAGRLTGLAPPADLSSCSWPGGGAGGSLVVGVVRMVVVAMLLLVEMLMFYGGDCGGDIDL